MGGSPLRRRRHPPSSLGSASPSHYALGGPYDDQPRSGDPPAADLPHSRTNVLVIPLFCQVLRHRRFRKNPPTGGVLSSPFGRGPSEGARNTPKTPTRGAFGVSGSVCPPRPRAAKVRPGENAGCGRQRLRAKRGSAGCGRRWNPHHRQLRPQGPRVALRPFGEGGTSPLVARDPSGRRPAPVAPLPTFRGRLLIGKPQHIVVAGTPNTSSEKYRLTTNVGSVRMKIERRWTRREIVNPPSGFRP